MAKEIATSQANPERSNASSKKGSDNGVSKASTGFHTRMKSKIIKVFVGSQTEPFLIHQNILCAYSPFSRKACNGEWKESKEGAIELPEDNPVFFEIYVDWLYFMMLFGAEKNGLNDSPKAPNWDTFIGLYILGDKLLDVHFRNSLINLTIHCCTVLNAVPVNQANALYSRLPESVPYRQLYVDTHAWAVKPSWYTCADNRDTMEAPLEFFRDVARAAVENREKLGSKRDWPWITDPDRYYHKHPPGTLSDP